MRKKRTAVNLREKKDIMNDKKFNTAEYVEQTASLLNLNLPDEYRDGVIANFERIQNIAKLVNEFPLPEDIEAAPVFEP